MGSSLAGAEVSKCMRRTAEWGRNGETVVIKVAVSAATAADLRHSLALSSACLSACLCACLSLSPFVDIIYLLRNSLSLVQVHFHNELSMPIARPGSTLLLKFALKKTLKAGKLGYKMAKNASQKLLRDFRLLSLLMQVAKVVRSCSRKAHESSLLIYVKTQT